MLNLSLHFSNSSFNLSLQLLKSTLVITEFDKIALQLTFVGLSLRQNECDQLIGGLLVSFIVNLTVLIEVERRILEGIGVLQIF